MEEINNSNTHGRYLEGLNLNPLLSATTSLEEAVINAHAVFMAIPSHNFRSVFEQVAPLVPRGAPIISMTKGLEATTQKRMTEVIHEYCPDHPVGVLTGPNLAREILEGKAAASVLALDDASADWLQPILNVGLFRVYRNDDVVGCELGGVGDGSAGAAAWAYDAAREQRGLPPVNFPLPGQAPAPTTEAPAPAEDEEAPPPVTTEAAPPPAAPLPAPARKPHVASTASAWFAVCTDLRAAKTPPHRRRRAPCPTPSTRWSKRDGEGVPSTTLRSSWPHLHLARRSI